MSRTASDYSAASRARKIAQGWKQINLLLQPACVKKLDAMRTASGMPAVEIIERLIDSATIPRESPQP